MTKIVHKNKKKPTLSLMESIEKANIKFNFKKYIGMIILFSAAVAFAMFSLFGFVDIVMGKNAAKEIFGSKREDLINGILVILGLTGFVTSITLPSMSSHERHTGIKNLKIYLRSLAKDNKELSVHDLKLAEVVPIVTTIPTLNQVKKVTTEYAFIARNETDMLVATQTINQVGTVINYGNIRILSPEEAQKMINQYPETAALAIEKRKRLILEEERLFGPSRKK